MLTPAIVTLAPGFTTAVWLIAVPIIVISLLLPLVVAVALCGSPERSRRALSVLRHLLGALRTLLRGQK